YPIDDTLFAIDQKFQVQPQMAESWQLSEDGLLATIKLREGLAWHDGKPVTAEDCIASLKRWQGRDSMGQKLADFLKEYKVVDERTFQIVLKERFGPLLTGGVDMVESVAHDLLPLLEKDGRVRLIRGSASNQYVFRMNWLQPPFNDPKARQAAFVALRQQDFLQGAVGDKRYWRTC